MAKFASTAVFIIFFITLKGIYGMTPEDEQYLKIQTIMEVVDVINNAAALEQLSDDEITLMTESDEKIIRIIEKNDISPIIKNLTNTISEIESNQAPSNNKAKICITKAQNMTMVAKERYTNTKDDCYLRAHNVKIHQYLRSLNIQAYNARGLLSTNMVSCLHFGENHPEKLVTCLRNTIEEHEKNLDNLRKEIIGKRAYIHKSTEANIEEFIKCYPHFEDDSADIIKELRRCIKASS